MHQKILPAKNRPLTFWRIARNGRCSFRNKNVSRTRILSSTLLHVRFLMLAHACLSKADHFGFDKTPVNFRCEGAFLKGITHVNLVFCQRGASPHVPRHDEGRGLTGKAIEGLYSVCTRCYSIQELYRPPRLCSKPIWHNFGADSSCIVEITSFDSDNTDHMAPQLAWFGLGNMGRVSLLSLECTLLLTLD